VDCTHPNAVSFFLFWRFRSSTLWRLTCRSNRLLGLLLLRTVWLWICYRYCCCCC